MIVDLGEAGPVRRAVVSLEKLPPAERGAAISRQGVEKIICAGVSDVMTACIVSRGMHVISGISGEVEQIIAAYRLGQLDQDRFRMPGGKKSESPSLRDQAAGPSRYGPSSQATHDTCRRPNGRA
jgi:predicted Fe-Mo cluster-binding NifX family protein